VVAGADDYVWHDGEWMDGRSHEPGAPLRIYEAHIGSWRSGVDSYVEFGRQLADHVVALGFTHVELLPVAEHPFGGSWGYQVSGYYAPTARYGSPDELRAMVDILHSRGIGVIIDWVPAHFPKDEWSLARFDGTALFEHADPRQGELRPQRGAQLPGAQRHWRRVPHRRAARRCRRQHAVPRLLATCRWLGAESQWWTREPRRDRLPA
jgi:1,4-alpha-glucan branching enzyme